MRLLHEIAIFQTVKSKVIISLFETVRLSVSISLRNLYNSLNSIKESLQTEPMQVLSPRPSTNIVHPAPTVNTAGHCLSDALMQGFAASKTSLSIQEN